MMVHSVYVLHNTVTVNKTLKAAFLLIGNNKSVMDSTDIGLNNKYVYNNRFQNTNTRSSFFFTLEICPLFQGLP